MVSYYCNVALLVLLLLALVIDIVIASDTVEPPARAFGPTTFLALATSMLIAAIVPAEFGDEEEAQ